MIYGLLFIALVIILFVCLRMFDKHFIGSKHVDNRTEEEKKADFITILDLYGVYHINGRQPTKEEYLNSDWFKFKQEAAKQQAELTLLKYTNGLDKM